MTRKILTYVGEDTHSLPVYLDEDGIYYKDTDPRAHVPASLYSTKDNDPEGLPEKILFEAVKFVPKRKTW